MLKIGVIEDEEVYLNRLVAYLEQFQKEENIKFQVESFSSASAFLRSQQDFRLLFIDIVLKDSIDGRTLARQIREKDQKVIIIFTTTRVKYAVNGYEVDALGYLVKPISYFTFRHILRKAIGKRKEDKSVYISCQSKDSYCKIDSAEIYYIEIKGHTLTLHTTHGNYSRKGTISNRYNLLSPVHFELCNQCFLVNRKYVYGVTGSLVKVGNERLSISRPKRKQFLEALTKYCGD